VANSLAPREQRAAAGRGENGESGGATAEREIKGRNKRKRKREKERNRVRKRTAREVGERERERERERGRERGEGEDLLLGERISTGSCMSFFHGVEIYGLLKLLPAPKAHLLLTSTTELPSPLAPVSPSSISEARRACMGRWRSR